MKLQLLEYLKREYGSVDGCYQPRGGPCYYIASDPTDDDHRAQQGRHFVAHVEGKGGSLERRVGFTFLVATMARLTKGHLIGDLDTFCREVGLERFRERLDEDPLREREDKLVLTRDSDDSAFQRPGTNVVIRRYQKLKQDILHRLADQHARGAKRVTVAEAFDGLCGAADLINRALNELTEHGLIRELNAPSGMRLTAAGQAAAEASLWNPRPYNPLCDGTHPLPTTTS